MSRELPNFTLEDLVKVDRVELAHFSKEDAFELGTIAAGVIQEWGVNLAVDVVIGDDIVYRAKFGTTGKGNDEWLAGKAAAATHFGEPSLLVKLRQQATGVPFEDLDLDHSTIKAHGGAIPLFVAGELVGTITMSGEPDVVDHDVNSEAVTRYLAHLAAK
ncbi:MAG: hypothetical protein JWQ47_717 [Glaciihabitans sp.]|nr:hypothetical protein [Glaciihabitans sp.]